jgi:hypothetical protein
LWAEAEELGLTAKEDDGELGFAVFEGEVDVAGGGWAAVGDLALDPDVGVGRFGTETDVGDEGANGEDSALGLGVGGFCGDRGRRNAGILPLRIAQGQNDGRICLWGLGWGWFGGGEEVGLSGAFGAGFAAQASEGVGWCGRVLSSGHSDGRIASAEVPGCRPGRFPGRFMATTRM